jgi:hypothetical protein
MSTNFMVFMSFNRPCDRCHSTHLRTESYEIPYSTSPEVGFEIKSRSVYLCEDCRKTTARELDPQIRRLNEAQELLDGKGDNDDEQEEE